MNLLSCIATFVIAIFILWIFFGGKDKENSIESKNEPSKIENDIFKQNTSTPSNQKIIENHQDEIDLTPEIIEFIPNEEFDNFIECDNICTTGKFCSKGEKRCRVTIEKIYEAEFLNQRPNFLKNPKTGHNLELDCYNEELKIAVEYNGEQHYKWPNYFHKNIEEFYDQIEKDEFKKTMCESKGVHLIIVPYNIPYNNIPSFILNNLPDHFDEF